MEKEAPAICKTKARFASEELADKGAEEASKLYHTDLATYKCDHCEFWHLTSFSSKRKFDL